MGELAFVIVTYQTRDLLRNCLSSIYGECQGKLSSWAVVVVDNASTDGTAEMVRAEFPEVELVVNPENLGPARAFNIGIARVIGRMDFICVMNSDVQVLPGTVQKLLTFLKDNPELDGASGPCYFPDMTPQKTRTHINRIIPVNTGKPFYRDFIGTTFAIIRSNAYRKVGGYDENYYFYNEDLDWAQRAKRAGCVFMHLPDARVIHVTGQGRKHNTPKIIAELYRSNMYYYKRFYPWAAGLAFLLLEIEIWTRLRRLRKELARERDPGRRKEIEAAVETYVQARRKLEEEYPVRREPRIPAFDMEIGLYDGAGNFMKTSGIPRKAP